MQPVHVERTAPFYLGASRSTRPSRPQAAHQAAPFFAKSFGNLIGTAIPRAWRKSTACACRCSRHGSQHPLCSHACPVGATPNGIRTSADRSALPHQQHRSGAERTGLRLSHSTTQAPKARASTSCRGTPRSNSAIAARSWRNAFRSWAVQPSLPGRKRATSADLWRDSMSMTSAGGGEAASRTRASPSTRSSTPAARATLRASIALTA